MKTSLVFTAAGFGSRFGGGIKQIEPIGPNGEVLMDYAVHDALAAGFDRVVFIIRKDIEADFRAGVGRRVEKKCDVEYVFQSLEDLPEPDLSLMEVFQEEAEEEVASKLNI